MTQTAHFKISVMFPSPQKMTSFTENEHSFSKFHFFLFHLKLGYFLGIFPWKISFNQETGNYILEKASLL